MADKGAGERNQGWDHRAERKGEEEFCSRGYLWPPIIVAGELIVGEQICRLHEKRRKDEAGYADGEKVEWGIGIEGVAGDILGA
jgi:hypothetical protein